MFVDSKEITRGLAVKDTGSLGLSEGPLGGAQPASPGLRGLGPGCPAPGCAPRGLHCCRPGSSPPRPPRPRARGGVLALGQAALRPSLGRGDTSRGRGSGRGAAGRAPGRSAACRRGGSFPAQSNVTSTDFVQMPYGILQVSPVASCVHCTPQ